MKRFLVLALIPVVTGCSSLPEWVTKDYQHGYRPYDPCIRCGEKWDQIPNEPFEAQKRAARGQVW